MMTSAELERTLRDLVQKIGQVPIDGPPEADFASTYGLDSYRMVEIFMAVEQEFGVTIAEDDYLRLRSLKDFIELIGNGAA
jgi:acyl carrier protein